MVAVVARWGAVRAGGGGSQLTVALQLLVHVGPVQVGQLVEARPPRAQVVVFVHFVVGSCRIYFFYFAAFNSNFSHSDYLNRFMKFFQIDL